MLFFSKLLNYVNEVFESNPIQNTESNSNSVSKLLIVLSDGRGIFYEGIDLVKKAVQKCLQQKIFIVFVILDIPGKTSVFDIRMSVTSDDNVNPFFLNFLSTKPSGPENIYFILTSKF
jgi:midasin (ATPase involved in ribosome maturation)